MTYQQHPLSAAFPAMSADEFKSLKDSIENIGVKNAITLYEGMVLDGWNRYQAAQELGMPCPAQDLEPEDDPRDYVKAQNKHRRHLTTGAWALIEVALYAWRPSAGRPGNSAPGAELTRTSQQMADSIGAGVRTIEQAKAVEAKAVPEVKQAVLSGKTSLKTAEQISKLPKEEQAAAVAAPRPAKHQGKPKKVPAVKLVNAEIKAANATQAQTAAEERTHQLEDELRVVREQLAEAEEDIASVAKVLDAGDQLAAALAEARKYRELANGLQARVLSMTTEIADLKRSVAYWEKKAKAVAA